jgi:hypothetical protein
MVALHDGLEGLADKWRKGWLTGRPERWMLNTVDDMGVTVRGDCGG